jgi:hypothetical protein
MEPGTELDQRIKEMIANKELDLIDGEDGELVLG